LYSRFTAPVLIAKELGGGLRCCIDYQDIISKTIMTHYPFPLIIETLNLSGQARIYTKLDVQGAYNLLRVKKGDENRLAFGTRYAIYMPTVM
jgi:hypothetical protein